MERVAVIIANYNMPERAGALVEYLNENANHPHDIILVDNGSDLVNPSPYTTVSLRQNVQTLHGWLMGLYYADALAFNRGEQYFAYWILTTSMSFHESNEGDPIAKLVQVLKDEPHAVAVSPAWTGNMNAWTHLLIQWDGESDQPEERIFSDSACMHRASFFDGAGRFDKRLTYSWGTDIDMALKTQQAGRSMYIHNGVRLVIAEDVGYQMGRMNQEAEERKRKAFAQMDRVMSEKWPRDWPKVRDREQIDHRLYH